MIFLRPELLTALLFLAIPIIIHLFEFRIFKQTFFTNVLFLEHLKQEQRRHKKLKKWLILLSRLGFFSGLILAFALPTIPYSETLDNEATALVIYLDNSFSTTAKSAAGSTLLAQAKEELYRWSKSLEGDQINWFTNNAQYPNQSVKDFQQSVLSLKASPNQLSSQQVLLNAQRIFSNISAKNKQLIWLTDYHNWSKPKNLNGIAINIRAFNAPDRSNVWLERADIDRSNPDQAQLKVFISNNIAKEQALNMRVYIDDKLFTQTGAVLDPGQNKIVNFDLGPAKDVKGVVTIDDRGLKYDDTLYFNVPDQPTVKILSLGNASTPILRSIFDDSNFSFTQRDPSNLDYTLISKQNLIILDQLNTMSNALIGVVKDHVAGGGGIVIIPDLKAQETTQRILSEFNLGRIRATEMNPRTLIDINTEAQFFKNVFEQKFEAFQYPTVNKSFMIESRTAALLSFDLNAPYLFGNNGVYGFSGPITGRGTNFDQSPLCVATFIELARQTQVFPQPYYPTNGASFLKNQMDHQSRQSILPGTLIADQVVIMEQGGQEIIPRQRQVQNDILLDFKGIVFNTGHYRATINNDVLEWFSFNHPREESRGEFNLPNLDSTNINSVKSIDNAMAMIKQNTQGRPLWIWFVIFALICFLTEMFILKLTT